MGSYNLCDIYILGPDINSRNVSFTTNTLSGQGKAVGSAFDEDAESCSC